MELARTKSCVNIAKVTVHKRPQFRKYIIYGVLAVLYAFILPWVWNTMGSPLERAIEEARVMDEKEAIQEIDDFEEIEIDIGLDSIEVLEDSDDSVSSNKTKSPRPLPSGYLSDAGAMFTLFVLVFFHSLFMLLCHWLVWFNVFAFYSSSDDLVAGRYLQITPFAHRGRADICQIRRSRFSGNLEFSFQKQKFEVAGKNALKVKELGEELQLLDNSKEQALSKADAVLKKEQALKLSQEIGFVFPLSPKINQPLSHFTKSTGFQTLEEVEQAQMKYGTNDLRADATSLFSILVQQLLSPLAIFQMFSASLWLLDQYWQQAIFSFVMIILMEFTTSFQRHRTANMLRNLAPKPFPVVTLRAKKWLIIPSNMLLPGDIISLSQDGNKQSGTAIVPCDCLILDGSAVVNEATLTGESVPQMKDSIANEAKSNSPLDVSGKHRIHVLFSGTNLVSVTAGKRQQSPNQGVLCHVLRTGFGSSQGELMQMIEFSTENATDSKETGYALLILLFFALLSSSYVFKVGMEKGKRTTHELLLRCVMIITSVVPQHLPVQMAAAINFALIALNKKGILCTEPFRLPSAGKITHCLFDKTGTLTSDELVPVGIINNSDLSSDKSIVDLIRPVHKASEKVAMVLSACHSLISLPNKEKTAVPKLLGDPIEVAAVKGVQWTYYPEKQTAQPGIDSKVINILKGTVMRTLEELKEQKKDISVQEKQLKEIDEMQKTADELKQNSTITDIKILLRQHFSSQLQRMSVVSKVTYKSGSASTVCLVKGSPEAIKSLLKKSSIPERYDQAYKQLAENGMRVLALGYKVIDSSTDKFRASNLQNISREQVEESLEFAGFIAFECKIRADTKATIKALNYSAHAVTMVTGDSLLTALHVARECCICLKKQALLLEMVNDKLFWMVATTVDDKLEPIPFASAVEGCNLGELSKKYDLLMTEKMLLQAEEASNHKVWEEIEHVRVFARMSPPGKAEIIRNIQDKGKTENLVFMCGDGGNDVGALKQADVGLALLSGFGSSNTEDLITSGGGEDEKTLNELDQIEAIKTRKALKAKKAEAAIIKKEIMKKQKGYVEAEVMRRQQNGEAASLTQQFSVVKDVTFRLQKEVKLEMKKLDQKYNIHKNKKNKNNSDLSLFDKVKSAMEDQKDGKDGAEALGLDDGQVPIVRPGDASVAAPFTSRVPSIRSVVHLIRQGRCTLLSALQQQQTMMLECTISAYTMAALSLEGARQSERQLLASSWLILTAVGSFSYSSPLETMHPVKPLRSLFHPAIISSIALQAIVHLVCISYGVSIAKEAMGDEKLNEVIDFNYQAAMGLDKKLEEFEDDYNPIESFMAMWQHPFKPNLLNTVVFLVQTAQTMSVFFVNYKGRPWMNGLLENHALFLSLFIAIGSVAVCAWEVFPILNDMLQLEPFPDNQFRVTVMILVIASIFGTFLVDRVVTAIFAPDVFRAMLSSAQETTIRDLQPIFISLAKGVIGVVVVGSSNPIIWIGAYWLYRKRKQYVEKQEEEKVEKLEKQQLLQNKKTN